MRTGSDGRNRIFPHHSGPRAALTAVSETFRLGAVRACRYLADGRMNRNWRLDCDRGRFALKELVDADPATARRNLGLLDHLAEAGVPVPRAVPTAEGDTLAEIDGHAYYATSWVTGEHLTGADMTSAQAEHMGEVIGRIHRALADTRAGLPEARRPLAPVTGPTAARAECERFLSLIAAGTEPSAFDVAASRALHRRLELIERHAHRRPEDERPLGPYGWIHGDCQDWNLIWTGRDIGAVIDWDRVRARPYGEEVVRAATWQFGLPDGRIDLGKVAALIAGYRTQMPIGGAALADAARRHWWKLLSHCWHLVFHYDRDDDSCDDLFFTEGRMVAWWSDHLEEVERVCTG